MREIKASALIEESYTTYGRYINTTRAVTGIDGLKLGHRRMLFAVRDTASNGWCKSASTVGRCLVYHPHAEQFSTLVGLVNAGFVEGHGNFGISLLEKLPPSAMRYSSVRAHKEFMASVFSLVPYVPHTESEDSGESEPDYLPVPVPLCFLTGNLGIGLGLLNSIPAFELESIIEAMEADNPAKLHAPQGVFLSSIDSDALWTKGFGQLTYSLRCYQEFNELDGKQVSKIVGKGGYFPLKFTNQLQEWLDEEIVYFRDESDSEINLVVSRVKNIRKITDEEVFLECRRSACGVKYAKLYVASKTQARRVGMRHWLLEMWERYCQTVESWKSTNLAMLKHKEKLYSYLPKVSAQLQKNQTAIQIAEVLEIPVDLVQAIEDKPLKMLRKANFTKEFESISKRRLSVTQVTAKSLRTRFIDALV